jgi:hypothetical protein
MRVILAILVLSLLPAAAAAQAPPDERAAAQAFADAAKRLIADADALPGEPEWLEAETFRSLAD